MPHAIDRDDVQRLVAAGALLVEVLPEEEYEDEHLAGAVNLSLAQLTAAAVEHLDRSHPVIVYCYDDM